MKTRKVDVAIIGAGSAGLNARRSALNKGASVLMIESGPYGTTCARVGCMPSKLLIAAADRANEIREASAFGLHVGEVEVDDEAVLSRVRQMRDRFAGGVVANVDRYPEEEKLRGRARFTGPTTLMVDVEGGGEAKVEAGAVVIATGSTPWLPPLMRDLEGLLYNDDVFELKEIPKSLLVVGTGVIGLELGQALQRLGAETVFVTVDEQVGPLSDPMVRAAAHERFGEELEVHFNAPLQSLRAVEGGYEARWTDGEGQARAQIFEKVLAATGRRPQLADLNLEVTGLELGEGGIPSFDPFTMQCGDAPIFLAGDITGERTLLHEASDEGQISGANAATFPEVARKPRRAQLSVVFSDPQIAVVGASFSELKARGDDLVIGQMDFAHQGRAKVMGAQGGLMRVYANQRGKLLGAEMLTPRAEHMAHLLAWAIQLELTVSEVLSLPFYHPVLEEGLRSALRQIRDQLIAKCKETPGCDPADLSDF